MAKFRGFEVKTYAELSASIAAGTIKGTFTAKQRVPFALKDPRGSKHKFYKRMKRKDTPIVNGVSSPPIRIPNVVVGGISQSFFYDPVPTPEYKSKLNERMADEMSSNAYQQASASIFGRVTFPADVVVILAEDGEDGIITGSYSIQTGSKLSFSAIANTSGYVDWEFINSSSFNTGASWSFANSESGCHIDGAHGNELHQFDATASFFIRTFASGSSTGSFISEYTSSSNITNPSLASATASRIDAGKFEYYEYRVPSASKTGSITLQSSAGFNSTIVAANIFGDGDEAQFTGLFNSASVNNRLFASNRELLTFPYDTVVASGSFFHSLRFETLVGVHNDNISVAAYSPIKRTTLYWASGSGGLMGPYGLSGSITPVTMLPFADSIQGIKSGSHIFLDDKLSAPASGGYYTMQLVHYPTTLSDGNFKGGLPVSGTVHVAGDGMRGNTVFGTDYFENPFVSAHSSSREVITAAPRWNGFSFSNAGSGNPAFPKGAVSPGLAAYITGSDGQYS